MFYCMNSAYYVYHLRHVSEYKERKTHSTSEHGWMNRLWRPVQQTKRYILGIQKDTNTLFQKCNIEEGHAA